MSKNQWIEETVELARTELKKRMDGVLELDGFDEDYEQDPELLKRMAEGNAWLRANAQQVEIGISGYRKRHGYTRADKARMKEALGMNAISGTNTKEEVEERQQAIKDRDDAFMKSQALHRESIRTK